MVANVLKKKIALRAKRKRKIRATIFGIQTCPRISIFRSNRRLYVQAIDDKAGITLCVSDGKKLDLKANKEGAKSLASDFANKLNALGVKEAVFDRNGYLYHGVVASFAQALRENGIKL